jgi:transposase
MTVSRSTFISEFRLVAVQLVVDQGYTVKSAAAAMGVGKSTMDKWVRQLKNERNGVTNNATPLTPDQRKIRELEKRITSAPLFLRKLVLGIPAQASVKNHVAINAFGGPIRPCISQSDIFD